MLRTVARFVEIFIFLALLMVVRFPFGGADGAVTVTLGGSVASYEIGTPTLVNLWVDPIRGNDANSGTLRAQALRTVTAAWNKIPFHTTLTVTGYRIMLVAGRYSQATVPNYWESRYGTDQHPIILQAADGVGSAVLPAMNIFDSHYLYLIGLRIEDSGDGGNSIHCERCHHFLLRQMQVVGLGDISNYHGPQETVKINQAHHVYVENSDISGAFNVAVDYVAVQYGHIIGSRIHRALDWCVYFKGGSAYLRLDGNEIYNCGNGGFTAGEGTGFEFMVSPWLHYEAYDVKFVNNLVHDTDGAGMGVNGGYNILLAYNTLYRVGKNSHVIEVVFGARACNGDVSRCRAYLKAGGWGTTSWRDEPIPDRNIYIYNNIIYNPSGYKSQWQHFWIPGPQSSSPGSNIPSPARVDLNLRIRGNVIWNGPRNHPLGIEDPNQGCQPSNPTCNSKQLRAENTINTVQPQLVDPAHGNFHPLAGGNLFKTTTYHIPDFTWSDAPSRPPVPVGNLGNSVTKDRDGVSRTSTGPPGAYSTPKGPPVTSAIFMPH